jgi:hypothetical protein
MTTNTIHRAELLADLTSAATERQQVIEQERIDSINQAQDAQENINKISQNERVESMQQYRENMERQKIQNRQLSEGYESLDSSRARVKSLRRKESLQAQKITRYKKLQKRYIEIKSQEIKEREIEAQNRQTEVVIKAREIINNILPFRQKKMAEIYESKS